MSFLLSIDQSNYLYSAFTESLNKRLPSIKQSDDLNIVHSKKPEEKIAHYGEYEELNLDKISDPNYLISSYIYRKALIRKHYLEHTIHSYVVKHPESILCRSFPETYQIEVDYAEFLDDSLDECYELRDEINKNEKTWILKPSMSDKGQGIRIFKTVEQLQEIFDSFEEEKEGEEGDEDNDNNNGIIISQLRHFIVQRYLDTPLLLPQYNQKKFHIRSYIVCSGSLSVYVYQRMLCLFASTSYQTSIIDNLNDNFDKLNLNEHLTNTCLQNSETVELNNSVVEFAELQGISQADKSKILNQINGIVKELFKAAINVDKFNFQPLDNGFEFYGLDFLVDENYNVDLLEVNAYPDFKQTGDDLKSLVYELIDETVNEIVSPFFDEEIELIESSNLKLVLKEESYGF